MPNLMYFMPDTVIIISLNGWEPIPRWEAYRRLAEVDPDILRLFLETQRKYLDNNPTPIERKKLIEGLKLIEEALQGKDDV